MKTILLLAVATVAGAGGAYVYGLHQGPPGLSCQNATRALSIQALATETAGPTIRRMTMRLGAEATFQDLG